MVALSRRRAWLAAGAALAAVAALAPPRARADEPTLVGVDGAFAMALAPPQSDLYRPGGTAALALHTPLTSWLIPTIRLRGFVLGDGPPPADTTRRDPGIGSAWALTLGLRLRPLGFFLPEAVERATSFWIELDAGGTLTGSFVRPFFDVGAGYGFDVGDVRLGPTVRFAHILHFDDPLDDRSAFLLAVGVEWVLLDRSPVRPIETEERVRSDRDGDGILDDEDACPDEPEDRDSFEDVDGCPDPDNDRDGILDPDDECALEPEDRDGWRDDDGCPEPDNDRDGILDPQDRCPNEPEIVNGVDDHDGCPDEGLIQMIEDRIVIEETVLFDFERARVKHSARPILQAIVDLWRQHPEWARMRVEGHADQRGDARFNQELSERRARRVRDVLVELGMPIDMIEVVGYGATRPRDTSGTEEGHQRNRRVEFVVVARRGDGGGAASDTPDGAELGAPPPGTEEGGGSR